jgi:hypothetical protein
LNVNFAQELFHFVKIKSSISSIFNMSDPVGLAGTIGTWVAVFLVIVALAGILPAYLLYQKSKTERAQALALVDHLVTPS